MQWLLQEFEDTHKLAEALKHLDISFSWHKVVPFVGDLVPEPVIRDPDDVVVFGSYSLWRYASRHGLRPGVFKLQPFIHQPEWHPFLLNGPEAICLAVQDIPDQLEGGTRHWFLRPVDDSKELPGTVKTADEIIRLANQVMALDASEIPIGSLRHDTQLMLTEPVRILKEWRLWVVGGAIVTHSLYKEGSRIVYRHEIDDDALDFARDLVAANPGYAQAYVIDICRTHHGLKMLETNCINAAGFYAADLVHLVAAIDELNPEARS